MTRSTRGSRSAALAHRLKELRESGFSRPVTQRQLAAAFGRGKPLSISSISNYENPALPAPPDSRLRDYAIFFATDRSLSGSKLPDDDELSDDEVARRDALYEELLLLRDSIPSRAGSPAAGATFDPWTFPAGEAIRLVCGRLEDMTHPYVSRDNPNHTEALEYADLDTLIELFGHIRMRNPDSDVRFLLAEDLSSSEDLQSHLVMLGGIGLNKKLQHIVARTDLPIEQRQIREVENGEVFFLEGSPDPFLPRIGALGLEQDVGLLARVFNPYNGARTLTLCNGVFSRGVYGAARTLTDAKVRKQNASYLADRFATATQFAILMQVPVLEGKVLTPDLQNAEARLLEWTDVDGVLDPGEDQSERRGATLR